MPSRTIPRSKLTASRSKAQTKRRSCCDRNIDWESSKNQAPNTRETPRTKLQGCGVAGSWNLVIGIYLELLRPFQSFQICQDQLRQIPAVTAFENAEGRNSQVANGLSQPMKILRLQCFLRDGVTRISVESGGHGHQSGPCVL